MASKKVTGLCRKTLPKGFRRLTSVLTGLQTSQISDVLSRFLRTSNIHGGSVTRATKSENFSTRMAFSTKADKPMLGRTLLALGRKNRLTILSENSLPNGLDIFSASGRRCISQGQGIVFPQRRKWWRYCGAVVLVLGVSTGAFFQYQKISLQNRGVSLFYIPHFPLQVMCPFGSYKGIAINTSMLNSLEQVENFEVREDDIFVASFPRSGE